MKLSAPISVGELLDKITILELKVQHISDRQKSMLAVRELGALQAVAQAQGLFSGSLEDHVQRLRDINGRLWRLEDAIRAVVPADREALADLAEKIIAENDRRSAVKSSINIAAGSYYSELKSY